MSRTVLAGFLPSGPQRHRSIRAFDLFAGIGGFRTGCRMALGREVEFTGFAEIDTRAVTTYRAMYDVRRELHVQDLTSVTRRKSSDTIEPSKRPLATPRAIRGSLPAFDLLLAGFPCQPHSLMGNREGVKDERGSLFFDIAGVLGAMRPSHFVLENVRAIKSVNGGDFFKQMVHVLRDVLDYNVTIWELNAADFGIPQVRRRLFIVGSYGGLPDEPPPQPRKSVSIYPTTWHLLERQVHDKYYLSSRLLRTILKHQHKGYKRKAEINRMLARPLTRTMHKMHRASQDNYFSDDFIQGDYDATLGVVHRARMRESRIRRITPREALRIQSFPDSQIERALGTGVSDTQLYMQAGNAAPPMLVGAVVRHLLRGSHNG